MFTGKEVTPIDINEFESGIGTHRADNHGVTRAFFYSKRAIEGLLSQKDAVGIRVYYAYAQNGDKDLYVVATDCKGNDIFPKVSEDNQQSQDSSIALFATSSNQAYAIRSELPCPGFCGDGQ